ncbi:cytochrome P450 [Dendrothele bispora CBS 962.96]|uniref:Cytochrome P450 n=1 Tax=Dendrothele bispora (strain CBS 962.96) TaxID=1314807 RepID=A0A4S8L7M7_DENBC|nr:cytochrome P450 [Dendrothele bispora CBS 962.96]
MNYLILATLLVPCALYFRHYLTRQSRLPLPPSPSGLPIVGNIFELAGDNFYKQALEWSDEWGSDIISFNIFGKTTIILNSLKAASDLFDKRGSNYLDRPDMPMIVDLMGWDWTMALFRSGQRWKEHRRVFHHNYNEPINVTDNRNLQLPIVKELLERLLRSPDDFQAHIRLHAAAIIMKRTYGHHVEDKDDPFVRLADDASRSTSEAAVPGTFYVDFFPNLKYVPEWMPGARFQRQAQKWRKLSTDMLNVPFNMVKEKMKRGSAEPCFVSSCLEMNSDGPSEEIIRNVAAVSYAAGNVAVELIFILAMTLHPEVQKRAQMEIDSVTGGLRLPTFDDRANLPYLNAVLKETPRWQPVLPLALPHRAIKQDQYKGYYIPANATVIGNAWAILHDKNMFPEPDSFKPERFINDPSLSDPADIAAFGFGRRVCAGKGMAIDSVWIVMASILAVLDISKAVDETGNEITPLVALVPESIKHPVPFKCHIKARSEAAMALLHLD